MSNKSLYQLASMLNSRHHVIVFHEKTLAFQETYYQAYNFRYTQLSEWKLELARKTIASWRHDFNYCKVIWAEQTNIQRVTLRINRENVL